MPDNVTSMMYNQRNGPPWHGKGVPVKGLATAAECIRAAGLDWAVAKVPLRVADDGALPVPGAWVTVRTDLASSDPRRLLGIVGEEYTPLQNWEAFAFFDKVVDDGQALYETAGAIENGRRVWLLARLPGEFVVPAGRRPGEANAAGSSDRVHPYLLLANGHDGHLMVHVKFTPVRVVCQNTLALALVRPGGPHLALRHDRSLKRRLDEAAQLIRAVEETRREAQQAWRAMADTRLARADAERYFWSVFGGSPPEEDEDDVAVGTERTPERQTTNLRRRAMMDFESEANRRLGIEGTLWAAYNAAVWAVDFARVSRKDPVDDLCLGEGARLKQRAFDKALALVDVE